MDLFEKQQRIESIQKIVKARWFVIIIIVSLGFLTKTGFFGGWAPIFDYLKIILLGIFAFSYNFIYWLFIRRPIEKIGDVSLGIITLSQILVDQLIYTAIFYFGGTVESITFLLYFITILIASSLYKTKGIVISGFSAILLHSGILIVERYGLIPHLTAYQGTVWFGNVFVTRSRIMGFIFYTAVAILYSVVLSNLIRRREKGLREKSEQLSKQTQILTLQTQELTQAQGELKDALTHSDISRKAATQARDEMEKANIELKKKVDEMEKFYNITLGREVRMAELKEEIKELKKKQGKK